ncbi:hypothetical protein QSJ18_10735 [Gordonia sp. ABSL1-1]|uniref:hypothetical protein n=1 Tax=Gordonia sp. ABSL1-1 TaxID=3053923 RepID=UPI002572805A|nr:hypothetical protein [Gordonia sp. ABSL1-1]MDL9937219.1 hypothetical protein [Gordonia sp. ABSL1-1]
MSATVLGVAPALADATPAGGSGFISPVAATAGPPGGGAARIEAAAPACLRSTREGATYAVAPTAPVSALIPSAPTEPDYVTSMMDAVPGPFVGLSPSRQRVQGQPEELVRIGNLRLHRPRAVSPEMAAQISAGSDEMVQGISDVLQSNGVRSDRADTVAEHVVGDAALGAVAGGAVAAPVAAAVGAVVGGTIGFVFGIPFLPTGLVVGPLVGTAVVATLVAIPAVTTGAVVGAVVGAQRGWSAPNRPSATPTGRHASAPHRAASDADGAE